MTRQEPANARLAAALRYARTSWPVFPCISGEKTPATKHGFLDATTDLDKITWWWSRDPERNVAIATGNPGPDVLDVDIHPDGNGFAAFNRLRREGLLDGATAYIRTPSGGLHAYFTGSDQSNGRLPGHHLDFRSRGGYVVAPPSQVGGKPYELLKHQEGQAGLDWAAVTRLLDPQPQHRYERAADRPVDASRLAGWVARLGEGNRNDGLFWAANRALEAGLTDLGELAEAARHTGLGEHEIARTLASARRTGRQSCADPPSAGRRNRSASCWRRTCQATTHPAGPPRPHPDASAKRRRADMTLVSARPVREHVLKLRAAGGTYAAIGRAARTGAMTVHCIANANRPAVQAEVARRLLAVTEDAVRSGHPSPNGTMWRLRALVAMGHSCSRMAAATGTPPATLRRIVRGEALAITPELRQAVIALFDAWWDKTPPRRTRQERLAADSALRRAALNDWPCPAGLDEDEPDRPGYQPQCGWRYAGRHRHRL